MKSRIAVAPTLRLKASKEFSERLCPRPKASRPSKDEDVPRGQQTNKEALPSLTSDAGVCVRSNGGGILSVCRRSEASYLMRRRVYKPSKQTLSICTVPLLQPWPSLVARNPLHVFRRRMPSLPVIGFPITGAKGRSTNGGVRPTRLHERSCADDGSSRTRSSPDASRTIAGDGRLALERRPLSPSPPRHAPYHQGTVVECSSVRTVLREHIASSSEAVRFP